MDLKSLILCKIILDLEIHPLDLYVISLDFYKLVVEELFFRLGKIFSELTWLVKTSITYCDVSFETTKSTQAEESRNGATGLRFY